MAYVWNYEKARQCFAAPNIRLNWSAGKVPMYTRAFSTDEKKLVLDGLDNLLFISNLCVDKCPLIAITLEQLCSETQTAYQLEIPMSS